MRPAGEDRLRESGGQVGTGQEGVGWGEGRGLDSSHRF